MAGKNKHVTLVGAARPNFMKLAPILRALQEYENIDTTLIHTGQHYDKKMSGVFFEELGIREPDINLGIAGGTNASQVSRVVAAMDEYLSTNKTDLVIVVGDVNATVAVSMACAYRQVLLAHVEAGLRSFDRAMPEENNRIVTDHLADLLFVTEDSGLENLRREGIPEEKIHMVGNVMIDTLIYQQPRLSSHRRESLGLAPKKYGVVTIHRPSNVDTAESLQKVIQALKHISRQLPLVFPVHVRTKKNLHAFELYDHIASMNNLHITEPLGYLEFVGMMRDARIVITDSGGIQEETTYLGIPCITLRTSTERPSTITAGGNRLVPDINEAVAAVNEVLAKNHTVKVPSSWDGAAATRICKVIDGFLQER